MPRGAVSTGNLHSRSRSRPWTLTSTLQQIDQGHQETPVWCYQRTLTQGQASRPPLTWGLDWLSRALKREIDDLEK